MLGGRVLVGLYYKGHIPCGCQSSKARGFSNVVGGGQASRVGDSSPKGMRHLVFVVVSVLFRTVCEL